MLRLNSCLILLCSTLVPLHILSSAEPGVHFPGGTGPGHGKHIVLIAGDDEYHSEEMLPQLAKILADRQGFDCLVLFSINPADGTISPHQRDNIPGSIHLTRRIW